MAWLILLAAGLCEMVWAVALKHSAGFSRWAPSTVSVVFMVLSVVLLAMAMKKLPMGTAYAVWTGIGAVGVSLWGMFFLGEPRTAARVFFLSLILSGIAGLKAVSSEHP